MVIFNQTIGFQLVDKFDDILYLLFFPALLVDTPAQVESLLHSLEQTAKSIGLYVNLDKIDFMCFNHDGFISSLNGKPLK